MTNSNTDEPRRPRVLLIDVDNCPKDLLDLEAIARDYDRVVACHGSVQPRIPLQTASELAPLIQTGRLRIEQMPAGSNAADFALTFWAGRLFAEMGARTIFHIASKDKDLNCAVHLLTSLGCEARRFARSMMAWEGLHQDRETAHQRGASKEDLQTFCQSLSAMHDGKPRTKSKLRNYASKSAPHKYNWPGALNELESRGLVKYDVNDATCFQCDAISQLAGTATAASRQEAELRSIALDVARGGTKSDRESPSGDTTVQMDLFATPGTPTTQLGRAKPK